MIYKTSELTGYFLDAAVAKALGLRYALARTLPDTPGPYRCTLLESGNRFEPSTQWEHGGPIIEREQIAVMLDHPRGPMWYANVRAWMSHDLVRTAIDAVGETPLVAAMRSFVLLRLGDEVDL